MSTQTFSQSDKQIQEAQHNEVIGKRVRDASYILKRTQISPHMYNKYIKRPEEILDDVVIKTTLKTLYTKYNGIRFYTTLEILDMINSLPNKEEIVKSITELCGQMGKQSSITASESIKALARK